LDKNEGSFPSKRFGPLTQAYSDRDRSLRSYPNNPCGLCKGGAFDVILPTRILLKTRKLQPRIQPLKSVKDVAPALKACET